MSHHRVKFFTKGGVVCGQSSPTSLFDFQMTLKKMLMGQTSTPMEIGMIRVDRSEAMDTEDGVHEVIERQVLEIVEKPAAEYEEVIINPHFSEQKIKVGCEMPDDERSRLIQILKDHVSNFAWTTADMSGLNPQISVHKLNIDPTFSLIRQKARVFKDNKAEGIKQEVAKLLEAKLIREVAYSAKTLNSPIS